MIREFKLSKTIRFLINLVILFFFSISVILRFSQAERLYSFLYHIPYNSIKSEIDNPRTMKGLYPDTLNWSNGGVSKLGLQALIWYNKTTLEYLPTELIGVRTGLRNVSDSVIQLGFAYYSPNKHGIPPEYTLFIEGPYNYPRVMGYMGDDAIYGGPRTRLQNVTSIVPGEVFNPSPDSLFYNASDGFFSFETPGTYNLWFTYSFDSLTSSFPISLASISSDTIKLEIVKPKFFETDRLLEFLPKKIKGFKSSKPETQNRLLNPRRTESLRYPMVYKHYFRKMNDFESPYMSVFIIDSGYLPGILNRYLQICELPTSSVTTIKGFQACVLHRPADESKNSYTKIGIMVAKRIIVQVEGFGVSIEEAERAMTSVDYALLSENFRQ
jgi:hypothetical protein